MKDTGIQWCDSSLNLMMGCDGCELWNPAAGVEHCYAGAQTARWAGPEGAATGRPSVLPLFDKFIDWCGPRVAVFVKQLGSVAMYHDTPDIGGGAVLKRAVLKDHHGGDWSEWTGPLGRYRVREMPVSRAVSA